ncbi:MAG TPA: xanthine dehydrogenase family protein molybdopterin-binding subunit, partial [Opitutaceae bacterium]|nr:xanthine dehydrogenase family protein molybdopterin-binding subunit [Opitutaceae bacterium]
IETTLTSENGSKLLEAEYGVPYLAHAPMEPLNCVVDFKGDRAEIWTGSQFQTVDRGTAAAILGLKPEQVQLHTMLLGGGFGRRANPASDFIAEAAFVAKATTSLKAPIRVVWTREDDLHGGYYRPFWHDRIAASLDAQGNLVAWKHTIVGQSILAGTPFEAAMVKNGIDGTSVEGAADLSYSIPNIQVDLHSPRLPVPVLWWRSVGHSHTGFVTESFLDEAAHASGKDPYQFRRALLKDKPRLLGVLDLVATKSDWNTPALAGRSRGIAVHESFDSYVAEVAEVSVEKDGTLRVHKVICAVDCGRVINPDTVKAQVESGVIFGLSAALYGEISLKDGKVEQSNFNDYSVVRINEAPQIEVHIVPSTEAPTGIGEPATPPIAPAVGNAIFAATGKRVRFLPFSQADLSHA